MKRTKEDTEATRVQILATASREFRSHGLHFSVVDLMKSAGLTHGGFYRHFNSKDDLIGEACKAAMASLIESLKAVAGSNGKEKSLQRVIEHYLSPDHRDNCHQGCPIAALGSELARSEPQIRKALTGQSTHLIDFIAGMLDASKYKNRKAEAQFILTSMLGAITLARVATDAADSNDLLRSTRERLIDKYCN